MAPFVHSPIRTPCSHLQFRAGDRRRPRYLDRLWAFRAGLAPLLREILSAHGGGDPI